MRAFVFFLLLLMTCAATPGREVTPDEWMSALDETRIIPPRLILGIRILDDRKDAIQQQVSATGEITVPYIGLMKAAGKTCRQLAFEIRDRLMPTHFQNPTVIVTIDTIGHDCPTVTACRIEAVKIQGGVRKPGKFEWDRDLTVTSLIRLAGGHTSGKTPAIRIIRTTPQGYKTIVVNSVAVFEQLKSEYDLFLRSYDVVIVE